MRVDFLYMIFYSKKSIMSFEMTVGREFSSLAGINKEPVFLKEFYCDGRFVLYFQGLHLKDDILYQNLLKRRKKAIEILTKFSGSAQMKFG